MTAARPYIAGDWLLVPAPREDPDFQLFCFPHAGGDATAFTLLARALGPTTEVWALRMPARGGRRCDSMPATFDQLVRTVAAQVRRHRGRRFGFYGQSFGALLAYEVALALLPGRRPELLVAAASPPPNRWVDGIPEERNAEALLGSAGMGELIDAEPELRQLALGAIQADLDVRRTYRYLSLGPVESDLYAVVGSADPMLDEAQLDGWAELTTSLFDKWTVPGGHLLATVTETGPVELLNSLISRRAAPTREEVQWSTR
ncbi:surfactin synthase thioesterase subunit [Streptacidiphilus sp. MAP12-16]|uniref:thioesterase II family protein n=1 Tax=Streptacidiphilus sp. MAP12-16 TaxID=3156300 RepID=UPI00351670F3